MARDLRSSAALAAPAASVVVVFGLFRLLYRHLELDRIPLEPTWAADPAAFATHAEDLLARLAWGLSALVFALAWLVAAGLTLRVIAATVADRRGALRWGSPAIAVALATAAALASSLDDNPLSLRSLGPLLERTFAAMGLSQLGAAVYLSMHLSVAAAVLLVFAASSTLLAPAAGAPAVPHLRDQVRRLRSVLYGGAAVLVSAVLQTAALHRLPIAFLDAASRETFGAVADALSLAMGTLWTLLLFAIYLPAALLLRRRALKLAAAAETDPPGEPEERLSEWGLGASPLQQLARLGALLGPVLAGGPLATLLETVLGA